MKSDETYGRCSRIRDPTGKMMRSHLNHPNRVDVVKSAQPQKVAGHGRTALQTETVDEFVGPKSFDSAIGQQQMNSGLPELVGNLMIKPLCLEGTKQ